MIIKTGAAGDVVRTTSLLNTLEGEIFWVTTGRNRLLLPDDWPGLVPLTIDEAKEIARRNRFTQVISLEEDPACAALASMAQTDQLAGVYMGAGGVTYTLDSASWFDMSRISALGLEEANRLKSLNTRSYQDHIFSMAGFSFSGEPYRIYRGKEGPFGEIPVGIERRCGERWPNKEWGGYDALIERLQREGRPPRVFSQRQDLRDYLHDIDECAHVVSGDTLAMHVALAYGKSCTAIFNCTSPTEIYDYGLLKKLVSPLLKKNFYSTSRDMEVIDSIPVEEVYRSLPQ